MSRSEAAPSAVAHGAAAPPAGVSADDAGPPVIGPVRPRRVLMILYHFPPLGGVATPRNVRNVEYLPRFHWEPIVITSRGASGPLDQGGVDLIPPGAHVFRAWSPEPRDLRRVADPVRQLASLMRARRPRSERGAVASVDSRRDGAGDGHAPALLWRVYHAVSFPDSQAAWFPFALASAFRAWRRQGFDVVYSTSAPITSHLVAGIVGRIAGVPWVAEFRDPWLGNPISGSADGGRWWVHRQLQVKVERWIVGSAARLVFLSPTTARIYRKRYPRAAEMVTITNGYDRAELPPDTAPAVPRECRRIVWTGSLQRPDELELLLRAVERLSGRRPHLADELEIVFYGDVSDACRRLAAPFVEGPLGSMLQFAGFVPRREALRAVADADAALLMLGDGRGMGQFVPGKLFDYVGHGRQLLAILPLGAARDILEDLHWGVVAAPDVADVARALEEVLTSPAPAAADPSGRYDRVALAGRLAGVLRAAVESADATEPRGVVPGRR